MMQSTDSFRGAAVVLAMVVGLISPGLTDEWTRFRGPNGTGVSHSKNIPTVWTDKDIRWRTPIPGLGHSSPVVWRNRVFVTATPEDASRFDVICVDARRGKVEWTHSFSCHSFSKH